MTTGQDTSCNNGGLIETLFGFGEHIWSNVFQTIHEWLSFALPTNTCTSTIVNFLDDVDPEQLNECGNRTQIAHFVGSNNDIDKIRNNCYIFTPRLFTCLETLRDVFRDWSILIGHVFPRLLDNADCQQQVTSVFSTLLQNIQNYC